MKTTSTYDAQGFTLIEIAIVLVIVGLLLGGLLMPLASQVEAQRRTETEKTLKEINEALIGYAMVNGQLPCPADPAIATGAVNAGVLRATCTGASALGVVPWVTLGVSEVDAWGRRFTYRVTPSFSDLSAATVTPPVGCVPTSATTSFALCSDGDMDIRVGAVPAALVAAAIPAVIVSHGKNGRGAYLPTGIRMTCPVAPPPVPPLPPPPPPDELENTDCPGNTAIFISHTPTTASAPSGEFDDLVTWIVPSVLKGRMVAAGRLP